MMQAGSSATPGRGVDGQSIGWFHRSVPDDAEIVIEFYSVRYGACLTVRDAGYSAVPSNPFRTGAMAH